MSGDVQSKKLPSVRLIHGDCLEVMPTLPAKSVQMIFADLPYRLKKYCSTECEWDVAVPLPVFWPLVYRLTEKSAAVIFTAAQPFTTHLITSNLNNFRYCLVWNKMRFGNFMHAKTMPMRSHEDIAVFYRERPTYRPQMIKRDKARIFKKTETKRSLSAGVRRHDPLFTKVYTHKYPPSIIDACPAADRDRGMHPTQKPVALLEWLIRTYTNEGDTILDPVFGSNTTGVACMRLGRNYIGIEKDQSYFEAGRKRLADEQIRLGLRVKA